MRTTGRRTSGPRVPRGAVRPARLGALAAVGACVAGVARRRGAVAAIAPELRTPMLWVPLSVGDRLSLAVARRRFTRAAAPVAGVTVSRHEVPGGQDVLVHEPAGRTGPTGALLWIHGGGLVLGRPEADAEFCSRMARDLGVPVVAARYRLAPEHPFPAGFDDCFAALCWLRDRAGELRVDPDRIAVGGGSAGGGLAASVVQRAHDEGVPVAFQLLVYPMLDDRTVLRRDHLGRGRVGWTPRSNAFGWSSYLGHPPRAEDAPPYAAAARREDLTGLPPAWIGVGDLDLFYEEDVHYARRLRAAGVPVDLRIEHRMHHAAERGLQDTVPSMRAFEQAMADALVTALRPAS